MTLRYEAPSLISLGRVNPRVTIQGGDQVVADCETGSGWRLVVTRKAVGAGFDAVLTNPFGSSPHASRRRATAELAIEKACDYLRDQLGQPHVASALRLMAQAEIKR